MKLVTFVIEKKLFFKYYISVNKAFLRLEEFGIDTNTSEGITDSKKDEKKSKKHLTKEEVFGSIDEHC